MVNAMFRSSRVELRAGSDITLALTLTPVWQPTTTGARWRRGVTWLRTWRGDGGTGGSSSELRVCADVDKKGPLAVARVRHAPTRNRLKFRRLREQRHARLLSDSACSQSLGPLSRVQWVVF